MDSSAAPRPPPASQWPSSPVKTPNCAKMAHLSSRFPLGGTMEGLRWGDGGGTADLRDHRGRLPVCHFGTLSPHSFQCQLVIYTSNVVKSLAQCSRNPMPKFRPSWRPNAFRRFGPGGEIAATDRHAAPRAELNGRHSQSQRGT